MGCVAARRHEPLLHAVARRARRARAAFVVAACASRSARPRAPIRMRRRLKNVLARRQSKSQEFFESHGGAVGQAARGSLWQRVAPAGAAGAARRTLDGRRPRLRHRSGRLRPRAVRRARDRRRSVGRNAPGRAPSACATCPRSKSGAASSRRCRSRTTSSTPRRCCSSCITCRIPAAALSEARRVLKPGGRLVIADMLPHDREEYRQQMGHVWLGFSDEQMRAPAGSAGFDRHSNRRRCRSTRQRKGRRCLSQPQ